MIRFINKAIKFLFFRASNIVSWLFTFCKFWLHKVEYNTDFVAHGIPIVFVHPKGSLKIGNQFEFNSGTYHNMIGRQQKCFMIVDKGGTLTIGNNVGISSTAIICFNNITIGDNVRIGGGTVIYDSDFHSLDPSERTAKPEVTKNIKTRPVSIAKDVFIGANCTILKGVNIGEGSIIGAGSVVSKSIPPHEIWGGNPAVFIKKT